MADQDVNPLAIFSLLFLIFVTLTFIKYVFIVFSMWAFAVGAGLAWLLLRNFSEIPNLLMLLQLTGSIKTPENSNKVVKESIPKGCKVCTKKGCMRHRPEVSTQSLHPWENIKIPQPVDEALTEFLEIVLRTHLYSWYWDLSRDQGFVDQLRFIIRYACSVILQRVQNVDIPAFLIKRCLKKFAVHTDCFFRVKERASFGDDIQALALEKMKTYRHFCVQNEVAEEEYLRYTVHALISLLIPKSEQECKASTYFLEELLTGIILKPLAERIAEPDFVNNLLLILLDEETLPEPKHPPSEKVIFLEAFGKHRVLRSLSALSVSAYDLMHEACYLYPLMQFMKNEGALNILQFCLAVEEFNKRSLSHDTTENDQKKLLEEAQELDDLYFKQDAVDKINFPHDVIKDFENALFSPKDTMIRLRTAATLFRAFEYAANILEKTYVPLFHQSEEFYALLCGSRNSKQKKLMESNIAKRKFMLPAAFSQIANTIKVKKQKSKDIGALGTFGDESIMDEEVAYEAYAHEMADFDDGDSDDEIYDLSYWHVTIPKIDYILNKGKKLYVFIINVEKIGGKENPSVNESRWEVVRKYNEFYVLDAKLKRFHELIHEAELPPKRTILKKDFDYLNSIRFKLQEYLQRLVRSPVLRASNLLHSFLTPGAEITGMFEPESVGKEAGRKVKSLKSKLVIEKGQNLEVFLNSFITSCEPPIKKRLPIKARDHRRSTSSTSNIHQTPINGMTQYALYAARNLFKVAPWLHRILVCVQFLAKNTIDEFVERYISYKLSLATAEEQMVSYIHLVRDIIFFVNDPPRTDSDKVERRDNTLAQLLTFLPERVRHTVGIDNHDQAFKTLFEMLQYPKLNKQLLYLLLDEVLMELFPELKQHVGIHLHLHM